MSAHRFFLTAPLPVSAHGSPVTAPLSLEDLHHAVNVLRVRSGEVIELVEPNGAVLRVEVVDASVAVLTGVAVEQLPQLTREPAVVLVQGVAKGEKMDAIVRHAVELGATEVLPFMAARSIVRLDAAKRAERGTRWRRIAKSAAEQAHRNSVPVVHDPVSASVLPELLADFDRVVVLWEETSSEGQGLATALAPVRGRADARVAVVVGPEGGLTAEEVEELTDVGAVTATLGVNVLRAETAALIALGLAIHELGGLGNAR